MPKQGQSVESCIISEWFVKKGDKVKKGDRLFSYETDKAAFEEESAVEGTILEIFFNEGDDVPVLTNVCVIGEEGEDISAFIPGGTGPEPQEASQPESIERKAVTAARFRMPFLFRPGQKTSPKKQALISVLPCPQARAEELLKGISGS